MGRASDTGRPHATCAPGPTHFSSPRPSRRHSGDYDTPWFYFDPSDTASLARMNEFLRRAKDENKDDGRMFRVGFPGNLPPPTVATLVDRLGDYFPRDRGFNDSVFTNAAMGLPLRDSEAATLHGTFSAYFQKLHAIHQMVLVGGGPISGGAGPCTPNKAHGYPTAGALGCLPLGPSHAFYDKLLREWMGRHGREKACALDSDRDMVRDACIPLVAPLTRFRDLCDPKREAWYTYA